MSMMIALSVHNDMIVQNTATGFNNPFLLKLLLIIDETPNSVKSKMGIGPKACENLFQELGLSDGCSEHTTCTPIPQTNKLTFLY